MFGVILGWWTASLTIKKATTIASLMVVPFQCSDRVIKCRLLTSICIIARILTMPTHRQQFLNVTIRPPGSCSSTSLDTCLLNKDATVIRCSQQVVGGRRCSSNVATAKTRRHSDPLCGCGHGWGGFESASSDRQPMSSLPKRILKIHTHNVA